MTSTLLRLIIIVTIIFSLLIIYAQPVSATGTSVSITLSTQSVAPGSEFTANLVINNGEAILGWSANLTFDPAKLTCDSVTQGNFLSSRGTVLPIGPTISNDNGTISMAYTLTDSSESSPAGTNGQLATIHFTAKTGVSGSTTIDFSILDVANSEGGPIANVTNTGASITIGSSGQTPTISSFTPTSGTTGNVITITGTNFSGATAVSFGGTAASGFNIDSATQITATVASGATGVISVTTPGGTATSSSSFTYNQSASAPTVTDFSPASGTNGTTITITGTNFTGVTSVKFGNTEANDFTINSVTEIIAVVGNGASGSVSVTTAAGTGSKSGFTFTTTPASTLSSITTTPAGSQNNNSQNNATPTSQNNNNQHPNGSSQNESDPTKTLEANTLAMYGSSGKAELSSIIDRGGLVRESVQYRDMQAFQGHRISAINVFAGTRAVNSYGEPVEEINVTAINSAVVAPKGTTMINALEFEPTGATFSIPIEVIIDIDPGQLPDGINTDSLKMVCYDETTGKWTDCDFEVDTNQNRLTAEISHFSLYALISSNAGTAGISWNMAGVIIAAEFAIVALVLFFFIQQRRRNLTPATVAAFVDTQPVQEIPVVDKQYTAPVSHDYRPPPTEPTHSKVIWDDILHTKMQQGKPFKTHLEIIGGKIIIPGDSKSTDIELINSPDSRVLISLEYEPETYPKGITKIMILGTVSEYEKSKETRK